MSKRLQKEFMSLRKSPLPDVEINIPSEENLHLWKILLKGPSSTPYANGIFHVEFDFPANYPFKPPSITFKTKIYHPNVKTDTGDICTDTITDNWGPTLNVRHCLETLMEMLKNPSADHPLEDSIATVLREKPREFEKTALKWTKDYAK